MKKSTQRSKPALRLSVETLESRSLLAGVPVLFVAEGPYADSPGAGSSGKVIGFAEIDSTVLWGWTSQALSPRQEALVVFVPQTSNRFAAPSGGPGASDASSRPAPNSGPGRPFGGFGGRRDPQGDGEAPPDLPGSSPAPGGSGPTSTPNAGGSGSGNPLTDLRPTTGSGSGSSSSNTNNSGSSSLGNGGSLGTPATLPTTSLPGSGANPGSSSNNSVGRTPTSPGPGDLDNNNTGRSTPTSPVGTDLQNGSRGPVAANVSSEMASLSNGSSVTTRSAAFESSRLDLWWTQSSSTLEQRSSSNGFNVERGDRDATDAGRAKLAKADRPDDADDWREDDSSADELDSQDSSTRDKQRGGRRDQRGHRFSTGLRGRMAWDRDWSDLAHPAEDAVDAILAALERSTNDAEVVEEVVVEGGLVEVIVAAAADRPLVD